MTERADIIIAEFSKNARETIRVAVGAFNGHDLVHIRSWVPSQDGPLIPTKAGIAIRRELLPQLIAALQSAQTGGAE